MPCWYFEKKELRNTPSSQDGIDAGTEARYRREGARFIIDAGTKMGLYPLSNIYCTYKPPLNSWYRSALGNQMNIFRALTIW